MHLGLGDSVSSGIALCLSATPSVLPFFSWYTPSNAASSLLDPQPQAVTVLQYEHTGCIHPVHILNPGRQNAEHCLSLFCIDEEEFAGPTGVKRPWKSYWDVVLRFSLPSAFKYCTAVLWALNVLFCTKAEGDIFRERILSEHVCCFIYWCFSERAVGINWRASSFGDVKSLSFSSGGSISRHVLPRALLLQCTLFCFLFLQSPRLFPGTSASRPFPSGHCFYPPPH